MYVREAWRRGTRRAALLRLRFSRHAISVPERLIVAPTDLRGIDSHVAEEIMDGRFPLDRLVTRYDLADINRAAADATSGATIKPVLTLAH